MATVWMIDDDKDTRDMLSRDIEEIDSDARIVEFVNLRDAREKVSGPDVAIVDISAVCHLSQAYMCAEYLWPFASRFPGCDIIVRSGLGTVYADQIRECFSENGIPTARLFVLCSTDVSGLLQRLEECLKGGA
jgi:hypothetical protein